MELTRVKPELVVHPARQRDSIPDKEKDNKKAAQCFLDSGVGLEQLTQIVDCSKRLTIL